MTTLAGLASRQRVLQATDHQPTDRLPRDFSAEPSVIRRLLAQLNLPDVEALKQRFNVDLERVSMHYHCPYPDGRNLWGLSFVHIGATSRVVCHPLADARTVEDIESYRWPDPAWADVESFRHAALAARRTGRAVVGSSWGSVFGEAYRLMGTDQFLIAMALYPDVAAALVHRIGGFFLEVDRRIFEACRGLLDFSYHGNDLGTQNGLLFSRDMFRQFFANPIRKLTDQARSFGLRTMFHSCGAVSDIIPDLIACGIEVLDPVQVTAVGMDPRTLKDRFGDRLSFHGAISAQKVLPLGTTQDVRRHVAETCRILGQGGGYVVTADQAITDDTPTDNIIAMYETLDELGAEVNG